MHPRIGQWADRPLQPAPASTPPPLERITPGSTIAEVLSSAVSSTEPRLYLLPSTATIGEASNHMVSHRISCVLVVDESRKVTGLLVRGDWTAPVRRRPCIAVIGLDTLRVSVCI